MGINENLRKDGTESDNHSFCEGCGRSVEDQLLTRVGNSVYCKECVVELVCECGDTYAEHFEGGVCQAIYGDQMCGCPKFELEPQKEPQEASNDAWSGGFAENH